MQSSAPVLSQNSVLAALSEILDPELGENLVDLGLIRDTTVDSASGTVKVQYTLTSLGCPLAETIERDIRLALFAKGALHVELDLVFSPPWDPSQMHPDLLEKFRAYGML